MSTNISNQVAYLRTSRQFPEDDSKELSKELNKSYLDIAGAVNTRTIGLYNQNQQTITGESWIIKGRKQQSIRMMFTLNSTSTTPFNHNIKNLATSGGTIRIFGSFTDGTNFYPLPYVDVLNVTNQINVVVSATQVIITAGAGSPPSIVSGYLVVEWLSQI